MEVHKKKEKCNVKKSKGLRKTLHKQTEIDKLSTRTSSTTTEMNTADLSNEQVDPNQEELED